jgi:hypothetical protein
MKNYTVSIRERAGDYEAQLSVGGGQDVRVFTGEGNSPMACLQDLIFKVERFNNEYGEIPVDNFIPGIKESIEAGRELVKRK